MPPLGAISVRQIEITAFQDEENGRAGSEATFSSGKCMLKLANRAPNIPILETEVPNEALIVPICAFYILKLALKNPILALKVPDLESSDSKLAISGPDLAYKIPKSASPVADKRVGRAQVSDANA